MASASNAARLCMLTRRRAPRLARAQHLAGPPPVARRAIGTSAARSGPEPRKRARDDPDDEVLDLKMMKSLIAQGSTPEALQILDELAKTNGHDTIDAYVDATVSTPKLEAEDRELADEVYREDIGPRQNRQSFWYDEDDPYCNSDEHDEFKEDDITTMAHGKLAEVREMRHYARLAVWEMPLLSKLAKPFAPPSEGEVLRWRYTTYMGEAHPAEKKVVVQFAPDDLKLTPVQTDKLKKLAGARYNPETELIKMSCESFEHQAQNKRRLSDLVDGLIAAATDPTDTFEDVPLDLRHHRFRTKPSFPKHWRMTDERRTELEDLRRHTALAELKRTEAGQMLDGRKVIDDHLMLLQAEREEKLKAAAPVTKSAGGAGSRRARR